MVNKIIGVTLLVFLWIFLTFWLFNHINAWVGIGVGVLGLTISANKIFNKLNKTK